MNFLIIDLKFHIDTFFLTVNAINMIIGDNLPWESPLSDRPIQWIVTTSFILICVSIIQVHYVFVYYCNWLWMKVNRFVSQTRRDVVRCAGDIWPLERPDTMPAIQSLEVMCGKDHMDVHLTFSQPFEGIVSSKGEQIFI